MNHIMKQQGGYDMKLNIRKSVFYERHGLLDKILDSCFDRAVVTDCDKKILFFSESSEELSGFKSEEVVGKSIDDFAKSNGFGGVLATGEADKGVLLNLDGNMGIATHIPVYDEGELLGAIGMVHFNKISAIKKILAEVPKLEDADYSDAYHSISRKYGTYTFNDYVGDSKITQDLIEKTKRAAHSNLPILFIGETGTGKEILANAVHNSNRKTQNNPFVKLNCSAIPSELLESELFGYEKGAFTGANTFKKGKFEVANDGSILLDEIGDMSYPMQTKLLRVLEEKEFERVGGNRLIPTNARVIASTNKNLVALSGQKLFREDLYFRLNTLEIMVPSLMERIEDLPMLVAYLNKLNDRSITFSKAALDLMMQYSWPGNVRQLRNLINRFSVLSHDEVVTADDVEKVLFSKGLGSAPAITPMTSNVEEKVMRLDQLEKQAIERMLRINKGNKSLSASALAISRSTLMRKLKQYDIKE